MRKTALLVALTFGAGLGVANAQEPLINVSLKNIRAEIARNMNISLDSVPINLQLPVSVAANLCGLDVGALGGGGKGTGGNTCNATNSTMAMQYVTNNIGRASTKDPGTDKQGKNKDASAGASTEAGAATGSGTSGASISGSAGAGTSAQ